MTFNKPLLEEGDSITNAMFSDNLDTEKLVDTSVVEPVKEETKVETTEDVEEVQDEVETEEETELDLDEEAPTEYEIAAQDMFQKGLIKELPKGVTEIPDLKTYNKVIEHNRKFLEQDILNSVYEDLDNKLSPISRQILSFDLDSQKSGGNVVDFVKSLLYTVETTSLDEEDPIGQEEIVYQYYLSKNMSEEEVNEIIDTLKENPEKLKNKAKEFKPKIVELAKKEAERQIAEQKLIEDEENQKRDYLSNKLADQLQTGKLGKISSNADEIPLTKEEAQWLLNASLDAKIPAKVKGKKVEMEMMEALTHYHKYHKDGNINLYMTALLLLKDPEKVIEHFKKIAKKEVVKEVRSDNTFGNTGLTFSKKKQETTKPTKGKPVFTLEALS